MKYDRIQSNSVEEAQTVGKLVNLIENGTTNLDDSEFGRVGGIGRGRENAQVTFNFTFGTNGVEETGDSVLSKMDVTNNKSKQIRISNSPCLSVPKTGYPSEEQAACA